MKLTFKEVAKEVGANTSTLAFQRDKFIEFIPHSGNGRNRLYSQEAIEVLKITSSMYADGKNYEEIREVLEGRYGIQINEVVPVSNTTTTPQVLINEIKEVFQSEITRLENKIDELSQGSKNRDELLMETLIAIREQQRNKSKKWWRFWK
jgi:DNA-binding transcriptional MerR regulator